jgi:hypothetical protein
MSFTFTPGSTTSTDIQKRRVILRGLARNSYTTISTRRYKSSNPTATSPDLHLQAKGKHLLPCTSINAELDRKKSDF